MIFYHAFNRQKSVGKKISKKLVRFLYLVFSECVAKNIKRMANDLYVISGYKNSQILAH